MGSRTEITIETERILTIGQRSSSLLWCNQCAQKRPMLTLAEVTETTGIAARAIFELAEVCRVHFVLTAKGEFLICPNSPLLISEQRPSQRADDNNGTV